MDRKERSSKEIRLQRLLVVGACSALATGLSACDPTAFISVQIADLAGVESTGIVGAECTDTAAEREFRFRFVATDTSSNVIEPGADLAGFSVRLNDTFRSNDVSIVNNTATIYPTPDVPCTTDADCDAAGLNEGGSGDPFVCVRLDGRDEPNDPTAPVPEVCGKRIDLEVDTTRDLAFIPSLPADDSDDRSIVVLLSGSNQMSSNNPFSDTSEFIAGLTPDPFDNRIAGLLLFLRRLSPEGSRFESSVRAEVGVFRGSPTYSGQFRGESGFDFFRTTQGDDLDDISTEIQRFINQQETQRGNGNHYAALQDAIERLAEEPESRERHIVLLTDGTVAADLRGDAIASGQTFDAIAQAAVDNNIHVHVIQIDGGTLGRLGIGGQSDLAQLACLTDGTFRYVQKGGDLNDVARSLSSGINSSFEVRLRADGLGVLRSGVYTMAYTAEVSLDDVTESVVFNGYSASSSVDRVDSRVAFRFFQPCSSDADCLLDSVCDTAVSECVPASDYAYCPDNGVLTAAGCAPGEGEPEPDPTEGSGAEPDPTPDEGSAEGSGA